MRVVLRVLAGLVLVVGGVVFLAGGIAAWAVGGLRTADGVDSTDSGAFSATLAPVQTDGYAIVVPDIAGVFARHGVARHLGDGRLTVTVRSASVRPQDLVVVTLVPAADAARYLAGIAHTEVVAVGYATGVQPVQAIAVNGGAPIVPAPWETTGLDPAPEGDLVASVALDVPTEDPMTLVVRRGDGAANLDATITVAFAPASLATATMVLLIAGVLGTLVGLALLVLRRPWIDAAHPMLDEVCAPPVASAPSDEQAVRPNPPEDDPSPPAIRRRPSRPQAENRHASPYVHTAT